MRASRMYFFLFFSLLFQADTPASAMCAQHIAHSFSGEIPPGTVLYTHQSASGGSTLTTKRTYAGRQTVPRIGEIDTYKCEYFPIRTNSKPYNYYVFADQENKVLTWSGPIPAKGRAIRVGEPENLSEGRREIEVFTAYDTPEFSFAEGKLTLKGSGAPAFPGELYRFKEDGRLEIFHSRLGLVLREIGTEHGAVRFTVSGRP